MNSISKSRSSYDTFIVALYMHQKEHLIPDFIRNKIPSSTASGFRNRKPDHYIGSELRELQKEMFNQHELMLKHAKLKRLLHVITIAWIAFAKIGAHPLLRKKHLRFWVVEQVQLLCTVMPKSKVLKLAGLSDAAFNYQLNQVKFKCGISPLSLCQKRHPNQLAASEIKEIKMLMTEKDKMMWPASSIFFFARRNKKLFIGQSTFYKYLHLLNLNRARKLIPNIKHGIKTTRPNQFLHVDTTFWTLQNGLKTATVFVSDNFSRHILGYAVSEFHGFKNVKCALEMALSTVRTYHPHESKVNLLADGGSENSASKLNDFIGSSETPAIQKWIAQKDVSFSNSPVEAVNKIFKRYLRHWQPGDLHSFKKYVELFVEDYTLKRPHGSLNGLTPFEAYTQQAPITDPMSSMLNARKQRVLENQRTHCQTCQKIEITR